MLELKIEKREDIGKPNKLRNEGVMPAVFYGKKEEATPISVSSRDFEKVYKEAGESTVITLTGVGEPKEVLVQDVDFHPVKNIPRHVDFYVLEKGAKVQVNVPLEFVGESSAVKGGGNLVKALHDIEIKVAPKDLPKALEVDISGLVDFTTRVTAKDIKLPESAELITKEDEVVALVAEAVEEKEEEVAAPDLDSIEVEKKGKEEAEGEGGEASAEGEKKEDKK
jgi:large subunit ribosomal protein L25